MPMTPFMGVRISWLMLARNSDFDLVACSAVRRALRSRTAIQSNKTTVKLMATSSNVRLCAALRADVRLSTIAASLVGTPNHFNAIVEKVPSCTMIPIWPRNKSATRAASGCLGEEAMPDQQRGLGNRRQPQLATFGLGKYRSMNCALRTTAANTVPCKHPRSDGVCCKNLQPCAR